VLPDEKNVKPGSQEVMQSVNNIYKISEKGSPPVQVTHHTDGNLFFPSMSADGKTIVYEEGFGLWKLDVDTGKSTEIRIDIKSDLKDNDTELRTIQGEAESFSLSPTNKRAAIATHGEIFTVATDRGEEQRVTDTPWRETDPLWSPNGKWIAFLSDRSGREEIWMADEMGHKLRQLTDADCDKYAMTWSPDSKSLMWSGSDHTLRLVQTDDGKTRELLSSNIGPISSPEFSPDGKWISYSKDDNLLRSHVYVRPLESGEERVIEAEDFLVAGGAKWTPDGKKLVLLGGVGVPGMSSLNRTIMQLYSVDLTRDTKNPDDRDIDTEAQAAAAELPRRGRGGGLSLALGEAATPSQPEVRIEWDGIDRRIHQLTRFAAGSVVTVVPSPDSRIYAFVAIGAGSEEGGGGGFGGPALYTISEDGSRMALVTQGPPPDPAQATPRGRRGGFGRGGVGEPQWARDGRSVYFMQAGGIYNVAAGAAPAGDGAAAIASGGGFRRGGRGGRGGGAAAAAQQIAGQTASATPRRVDFTVRIQIDRAAERKQVFEEAWRVMRNRFYDAKMHEVDWDAAKATYEPLLNYVADTDELHTVIMQMIGELNASHTGISGGENAGQAADRIQTLYPGFDLEPDPSGYYKVSHIYRKGPADHDYLKLAAGDFILAVNGVSVKTSDNYWKLFNILPGRKFEFTMNSKPQADDAWTVGIEPIGGQVQAQLEYDRWVDGRRAIVDKLSNGQIGYLHIKAMDAPSLQRFERDLLDNIDKKALIIDERFNGGGGIDQELLEILNQHKKYQSWRARDSVEIPRPVQAFLGPMVVLQNERSASNAEMFPEGFRELGLGKVIGTPTYGAVIGTGAFRLLDGSTIRTPSIGVFTAKGVSLENYGVQPDVAVDNTPPDFLGGHDRQIEKAVEVLAVEMLRYANK